MKWKKWLDKWGMTSLKINAHFLEMEWEPQDEDKDAAWELYIELLTRITTQPLPEDVGDEQAALDSVYALFGLTRDAIKRHGRHANEFTKIAIVILNQIVRPFTAKWHKKSLEGAFEDETLRAEFRRELVDIQVTLRVYTNMLADMAMVEDLVNLESIDA